MTRDRESGTGAEAMASLAGDDYLRLVSRMEGVGLPAAEAESIKGDFDLSVVRLPVPIEVREV